MLPTPRNLIVLRHGEVRGDFYDAEEIAKGSDLIEEEDEVLQLRRNTEEDDDMEYNIQEISKVGDLSPRHTNSLKYGA
ncbi:hypothetical protein KY284_020480 [Solanum tuberosum]|nr:hypothetical protein KY284_020480 [Solanum tuberosum]